MKKVILSTAFAFLCLITFGQSGNKSRVSIERPASKYVPAPDKKFVIEFTANEFDFMLACAQFGFQPYVKTTSTPINQVETLQQSYTQVLKDKIDQFKKQYTADSIRYAKVKQ